MSGAVKINDRTPQAIRAVDKWTDKTVNDLTDDAMSMARQLMADEFVIDSTGALAASLEKRKSASKEYEITSKGGYGMPKEWGYHTQSGSRVKGHHILLRSTKGMFKRFLKGGRWTP